MNHYDYHTRLKALWEKGVEDYSNGGRVPGAYLTEEERAFLGEIGANEQDLYDFTDDSIRYGEPDFEMFWAVQSMRFNYFKMIMKNRPGDYIAPMAAYSPKDAEINGIPLAPQDNPKSQTQAARGTRSRYYVRMRRGPAILQNPQPSSGRVFAIGLEPLG